MNKATVCPRWVRHVRNLYLVHQILHPAAIPPDLRPHQESKRYVPDLPRLDLDQLRLLPC